MTGFKTYASSKECIYCGIIPSSHSQLTDEHIIPLGLDGALIFKDASCVACNEITSRFEQKCLQRMFREARVHLNIPKNRKRRKKMVPSSAKIGLSNDGRTVWKNIEIADHPGVLVFPDFGIASILENGVPSDKTIIDRLTIRFLSPDFEDRFRRTGSDKVFQILDPEAFCQMLAKIGHAYAVAERGQQGFMPLLPDVILGRSPFVFHFVGGGSKIVPSDGKHLHRLGLSDHRGRDGRLFLIANIQLLALYDMPVYHAVVGILPVE